MNYWFSFFSYFFFYTYQTNFHPSGYSVLTNKTCLTTSFQDSFIPPFALTLADWLQDKDSAHTELTAWKAWQCLPPQDTDTFYWTALFHMTWCNVTGKCGIVLNQEMCLWYRWDVWLFFLEVEFSWNKDYNLSTSPRWIPLLLCSCVHVILHSWQCHGHI